MESILLQIMTLHYRGHVLYIDLRSSYHSNLFQVYFHGRKRRNSTAHAPGSEPPFARTLTRRIRLNVPELRTQRLEWSPDPAASMYLKHKYLQIYSNLAHGTRYAHLHTHWLRLKRPRCAQLPLVQSISTCLFSPKTWNSCPINFSPKNIGILLKLLILSNVTFYSSCDKLFLLHLRIIQGYISATSYQSVSVRKKIDTLNLADAFTHTWCRTVFWLSVSVPCPCREVEHRRHRYLLVFHGRWKSFVCVSWSLRNIYMDLNKIQKVANYKIFSLINLKLLVDQTAWGRALYMAKRCEQCAKGLPGSSIPPSPAGAFL